MFKRSIGMLAMAGASMAAVAARALDAMGDDRQVRIYGFEAIKRALQRQKSDPFKGAKGSIATGNRHTGGAHLHTKANARRVRQMERNAHA